MFRRLSSARVFCPRLAALGAGVLIWSMAAGAFGDAQSTPASLEAAQLVQAALDAELAGDATRHRELLEAALKADPEYAPAHWHRGEVKFQGKWQSFAEVGEAVSGDPLWAAYRQRRRALTGNVDEHRELARWCEQEELADEARYHWANVLLASPNDREARERLGLVAYRGGLFTAEEIAQEKERLKQAKRDFEEYKPILTKLCARATTLAAGHEDALAEVAAIHDPAQLEALDYAVERACRKAPAEQATKLMRAHVAALSEMPQHAATLRLLNYAVLSPSEEIRARAAQGLSSRPATDYVPLLMAALTAPYEADTVVYAAPDGTVRLFQTIRQEGPEASRTHVQSLHLETEGALNFDRTAINPGQVLRGNLERAQASASQTRELVEAANAAAEERNKRIAQALKGATGSDPSADAESWWRAWQEYNELAYAGARPEYTTSSVQSYTYRYPQAKPAYPSQNGPRSGTQGTMRPTTPTSTPRRTLLAATPSQQAQLTPTPRPRTRECFAAGTLVWTKAGPTPIETVAVGDLVLAQHPVTGELGFRAVLEATVSEPVPVVALKLPRETIVATLGHRFWTVGHGWQMAKSFKGAVRLHALGGAVDASPVDVPELTVCHNLVVDEFHTFFVGQSRLLVHDKTCPAPNPSNLPGSKGLRAPAAADREFAEALNQASL